jgi:hypothetical protein
MRVYVRTMAHGEGAGDDANQQGGGRAGSEPASRLTPTVNRRRPAWTASDALLRVKAHPRPPGVPPRRAPNPQRGEHSGTNPRRMGVGVIRRSHRRIVIGGSTRNHKQDYVTVQGGER